MRYFKCFRKHKYNVTALLLPPACISKGSYEGKRSGNSRRVDVLNKLFMRYITDLMATGERSSDICGRGIEINRVRVTPDYTAVHVFWKCSEVENEQEVENNLKSLAGDLRCELANLNIVGLIPKIVFFRDKDYCKILRIDERLAIADFGEDHEPQQYKPNLKAELKLRMRLDVLTKLEISKLDNEILESDVADRFPQMPQNVLGLDHSAILKNVIKRMKNTAPNQISATPDNIAKLGTINDSPIRFSNKAQNEAFNEFLSKRKILEIKAKQESKKYRPELEYIHEERISHSYYEGSSEKDTYLDNYIEEEQK